MIDELKAKNLKFESQVNIPLIYKGKDLNLNLKLDLLVEDLIIIELKSVDKIIPIFNAQLMTYLKLTKKPKGLLINFNTEEISSQLISIVTEIFSDLPFE